MIPRNLMIHRNGKRQRGDADEDLSKSLEEQLNKCEEELATERKLRLKVEWERDDAKQGKEEVISSLRAKLDKELEFEVAKTRFADEIAEMKEELHALNLEKQHQQTASEYQNWQFERTTTTGKTSPQFVPPSDVFQKLRDEFAASQTSCSNLSREKKELEHRLAYTQSRLSEEADRVRGLEEKLTKAREKVGELERTVRRRDTILNLQKDLHDTRQLQGELAASQESANKLAREKKLLEGCITDTQSRFTEEKKRVRGLDEKLTKARERAGELERTVRQRDKDLESVTEMNMRHKTKIQINELSEQLMLATEKLERNKAILSRREIERKMREIELENARLKSDVASAEAATRSAQSELREEKQRFESQLAAMEEKRANAAFVARKAALDLQSAASQLSLDLSQLESDNQI